MRSVLSVLTLVMVTACGSAARSASGGETPEPADGTYQFSASVPNQVIRGTITMGPNGAGIQFETPCQPEVTVRARPRSMPSSMSVWSYYCSGSWLTFDRSNPAQATWYANVEVPRRREVCSRYETQNGRQVCVARATETYYVAEPRSGGIQVQRVP